MCTIINCIYKNIIMYKYSISPLIKSVSVSITFFHQYYVLKTELFTLWPNKIMCKGFQKKNKFYISRNDQNSFDYNWIVIFLYIFNLLLIYYNLPS